MAFDPNSVVPDFLDFDFDNAPLFPYPSTDSCYQRSYSHFVPTVVTSYLPQIEHVYNTQMTTTPFDPSIPHYHVQHTHNNVTITNQNDLLEEICRLNFCITHHKELMRISTCAIEKLILSREIGTDRTYLFTLQELYRVSKLAPYLVQKG
jgi:hypothetical protein